MLQRQIILILFACIGMISCFGQSYKLSDFVEVPVPKSGSAELSALNWSNYQFSVAVVDGKLELTKFVPLDTVSYRVTDSSIIGSISAASGCSYIEYKTYRGSFIGIDCGEWGGELLFVTIDRSQKPDEILHKNIRFIFPYHDEIYAVSGLSHMGLNEGAIYRLNIRPTTVSGTWVAEIGESTATMQVHNNSIFIVTGSKIYDFKNMEGELLFQDPFLGWLAPNSMAMLSDEDIFIGVSDGYLYLDLRSRKMKFYRYKRDEKYESNLKAAGKN